jgi:hypothetical protein
VDEHRVAVAVHVLEAANPPTATMVPAERARVAWALTGAAALALVGAGVSDWLERRPSRRAPPVWTARVGAGGESGSVALLLASQDKGPSGGPVVLLLSGNETQGAAPDDETPRDPEAGA